MGNCFGSSGRVNASQTTAGVVSSTKPTSNSCQSTFPSSLAGTSLFSDKSYETNNPALRSEWDILACPNLKPFTFTDLKNATRNFQTLLGEGGFGYVYKGWLDEQTLTATKPGSGMTVAVKKLKPEGFQGHKEWLTEVDYLGQLDHPNIVKLVGYCSEGENRLLVYEFLPKGNVESHLFRRGSQAMPWEWRMKVAMDAARGLSFLHDSGVIFRDFKASNILLDAEFNAKLSDFGLAKAGPTGDRTHVSTQVVGTQGYAAPEYIATGRLTANCDIYSFGVFLVELLSGRRALYKTKVGIDQNLADWARPHLRDRRKLFKLMDSKLEGQYPKKLAHTVSTLAMECLRADAKQRPKMTAVLTVLEQISASKHSSTKHSKTSPKPVMKCPRRLRSPMNPAPIASSPRQLRFPVSLTTNGSSSPLPSLGLHMSTEFMGASRSSLGYMARLD